MVNNVSYLAHKGQRASPSNCPSHIAIIMDGNGRWAKNRSLSRTKGHRKGVEAARDVVFACADLGIQVLTLFAFGLENHKRPSQEIRTIFRIFFIVLRRDVQRLHERNIQLRIIGDRRYFNTFLLNAIEEAEALTAQNTGLVLNIAINYSGRWDLINAIQQLSIEHLNQVDEAALSQGLALHSLPDPDLFIRTGGVQRLSNFMLWELAYTELYFTPTLWPDFNREELQRALTDYAGRERRFGLTGDQL